MRIAIFALIAGVALVLLNGCRSANSGLRLAAEEESPWNRLQMEAHLRVLNSSDVEGRVTGTQGYARAAEYVAAQMGLYELQPGIGRDYRLLYPASLNYVNSARLALVGRDTLRFSHGIDFLADARSDSGTVHITRLVRLRGGETERLGERLSDETAILVESEQATDQLLIQLQRVGASVVFISGELIPDQSPQPLKDVLVLHVTPTTTARIEARLGHDPSTGAHSDAENRVLVQISTQHQAAGSAINVLGYLAGKHPVLAQELVIVCAGLDAVGRIGSVPTIDFKHFGTGVAAMLEVARVQAEKARVLGVPDRTILFAAWAGERLNHMGFQAYLNRPVWPLDATRAVIYLGLRPEDEPSLREHLDRYGIALYAIPVSEPLVKPGGEFVPLPREDMVLTEEGADEVDIDMSQTIDRASMLAERMAEHASDLLSRLAVTPSPGVSALERSLRVPAGAVD